jgi:hypothetical protein
MLWSVQALSRWGAVVTLSLIGLMASWFSISGKATWNDQLPAMNAGILSFVASGGAGMFLLLSGRRAVGVRRITLLGEAPLLVTPYPDHNAPAAATGALTLVAGPGLARFHRSDCAMATSKHFQTASRTEHEREGRTACGVCRP